MVADSQASPIFQLCLQQFPDAEGNELLECVANALHVADLETQHSVVDYLHVISGAMIFFMQAGFATLCAGAVRLKNVQNTMLKNLLDACGAAIAFYLIGYAFAFGGQDETTGTTFIGTSDFISSGPSSAFWFFQYTFSATSVTIVAGTLAERCQMAAYLSYSCVLAGFIYPVVAHAIWSHNGFLSKTNADPFLDVGALDFAGSGVVHLTGGATALYATLILGPRRGRFYNAQGEPLGSPKPFPGHSVALQVLGTMILWFGWFGFNVGSSLVLPTNIENVGENAANAAVSTALSGAMGGISALFTHLWWVERRTGEPHFDLIKCMNGALAGLVAITGGCGVVEPWAAIIIGLIAGWLYLWSSALLVSLRIDDAVDAIPVHMVNGIWGVLSVGFLARPERIELAYGTEGYGGWFYNPGDGRLLAAQVCEVLFIIGWTLITLFPFFIWLNYKGWLRADSLDELVGLDISYHGGSSHAKENGYGMAKEFLNSYNRHHRSTNSRSTEIIDQENSQESRTQSETTGMDEPV